MAEGKNIAIIIPSLSGGGAERVASVLSGYFAKKNNVFLFLEKYEKRTAYIHSGKIDYYPDKVVEGSLFNQIGIIMKKAIYVRKLKKKYNIDVAISFMEEANFINVLSKGREKIILRVCTILSERLDEFKDKIVYRKKFLSKVYNCADNIVVMTEYAKRDLIEHWNIKKRKIAIIENPLDFNYINKCLEKEIDWKYGEQVVISVNRLDTIKRQWHLVKAFSIVHEHIPHAKLVFVGSGSCKNRLSILAKKYNIEESVIFAGKQDNVYLYIKNSKVFVLSSKTEGFPNGMIEALYVGTPVVSVDCPGAPKEILAGKYIKAKTERLRRLKYGVLFPDFKEGKDEVIEKEERELAEAMIILLSNEDVYLHYKDCARQYVKRYKVDYIGGKWDEMFN